PTGRGLTARGLGARGLTARGLTARGLRARGLRARGVAARGFTARCRGALVAAGLLGAMSCNEILDIDPARLACEGPGCAENPACQGVVCAPVPASLPLGAAAPLAMPSWSAMDAGASAPPQSRPAGAALEGPNL